jgi:predicted aminopeptidase
MMASKGRVLIRTLIPWGAVVVAALFCGGCQTAQFYSQAVRGQTQILRQREPIAELIEKPGTAPALRAKFELVNALREFARAELRLPINDHYTTYVDLGRRFAVWNVHAAPEFSLEPRKWWYPFVGKLKYRGYFSEEAAREYGDRLAREEGDDVYVEGTEAYSTLGWFADPLLNTFIHHSEPVLAEILFHELAHQRLFLKGDTDFNEAFATAVGEEGVRRWFLAKGDSAGYEAYTRDIQRTRQFVQLVMNARAELQELYDADDEKGRRKVPAAPEATRAAKQAIIKRLRERYEQLKVSWGGASGLDGWFRRPLNNAQLNTIAVYYELVPGFEALLRAADGDLERFYKSVRALRKLSKEERHFQLRARANR